MDWKTKKRKAMRLREYQTRDIESIRNEYRRGMMAPLYVLPTGGGKTVVMASIAWNAVEKGNRVLILVHRVELLRQTANKIRAFGVRVGLVSPLYSPDYTAPVQVAMVQTMVKRLHLYKPFDLVFTDEAHHSVAGQYVTVQEYNQKARFLGVTATPVRTDGLGLGKVAGGLYDSMVTGPTIQNLIDDEFLVRPALYGSEMKVSLKGIRLIGGDFNKKQLQEAFDKASVTGDVVEHYRSMAHQVPGVIFCVSVQHAIHVAGHFRAAGYRAYHVDGGMEDKQRDAILQGLADGSVHVVTSCDLISEGFDIPAIGVAGFLRPTESTGLYLQQGGRALRPCEGKDKAIILDHVDNWDRHGFIDEDREWSLEGKKRKEETDAEAMKRMPICQCSECFAVYLRTLPECPECGAPTENAILSSREVKANEGRLTEISKEEQLKIRYDKLREENSAKTLEALEAIAEARGYKKGWARHKWEARQRKAEAAQNVI